MSDNQVKLSSLPAPPGISEPRSVEGGFDPEDLIGETLAGRYEITQRIGRGGMGVVYLASQSALHRKVVVKVLAKGLSDEDEALTRFEREALGLSQLQHANIVTIYDFGRDKDLAYIVMEYVEGETLNQLVRRKGAIPFEEFAQLATQILEALSEAHAQGIIHRDIKPSNIMMCERHGHANFVKVLDFGLAKLVHDSVEVTKKQNLVGSVAFLAPEQILGLDFDQRVDVYALGVLFYLMLSGQKPFRGEDDISVLYQHIHKDPTSLYDILPPNHGIPDEVIALIHMCLAKDPRDRPNDARDFLNRIQSDMSQSIFKAPWTTGEFAPLKMPSGSSGAVPVTPNPARHVTPHSGLISVLPGTDVSGQYTHLSQASLAGVSNPYLAYPPPPQSRTGLFVGGALIALLAIGVGAFVPALITQNEQESSEDRSSRLEQMLENVKTLVHKKQWGQAEQMLATLEVDLSKHPDLMSRSAKYSTMIKIGKLLVQARALEEAGKHAGALSVYQEILGHDANHEMAKQRVKSLALLDASESGAPMGTLKVDARTKARVFVDGTFIGYTPVTAAFESGSHSIKVVAKGFASWSKKVELVTSKTLVLDARLTSMAKRSSTAKRRSGRKKALRSTGSFAAEVKSGKARDVSGEQTPGVAPKKVVGAPVKEKPSKKSGLLFKVKKAKHEKKKPTGLLPVD